MKKLLLASVAVSGLAFAAAPAHANIDLTLGGYFKGYGAFVDQDESVGTEVNTFDILRATEIHIGGETTLDNGLTVGAHFELEADMEDSANINESYVYFSGDWGRVNFGGEDGAAFLLQVAAPGADANIDGVRQLIQPFVTTGGLSSGKLDYANDPTGKADKFTYLSPVFYGFQAGLTYSPDTDPASSVGGVGTHNTSGTADTQDTVELAVRYEGQFEQVGVIAGAGYSHGNRQGGVAADEDREVWNVGLDLNIGAFGVGAVYTEDNRATENGDADTWVLGADYTTGPFTIGASYFDRDVENGTDIQRYTGGVSYEYGPGMSFRGSIQHIEFDPTAGSDSDGTAVLLGTNINF